MTALIQTHSLGRTFGDHTAVDDLTLRVEPGEILALLGPNGAGKTTTVRLLNGVLAPTSGSSTVLGYDPATEGDILRHYTGVLTENAGLDDRLTARENLAFAAQMRGMDRDTIDRRVGQLLEQFDLNDLADRRTQGFSTGQRKRLALIRALIHEPQILFLDEPTSGLDPTGTREVVDLIERLARDFGRTIVLCTHFLGEADRLADRMAFLDHGRLRAFGRPAALANELWSDLQVDVDLGQPAGLVVLTQLQRQPGIVAAQPTKHGAEVTIVDRSILPSLTRGLVQSGYEIFGVTARPPTLSDLYFALETRVQQDESFCLVTEAVA